MLASPNRGPIIRMANSPRATNAPSTGINCCCCSCFTCLNTGFVRSEDGILKIVQVILASFCQSLAINFGLPYAATMGTAYHGFLTTVSWGLMTSFLLLVCYIFSTNSFNLIRQSLFELFFNAMASFSYLSSSFYLAFAVTTFLYPQYIIVPYFQVYPAMSAAYMLGGIVGILHGYDAYKAYKFYKGYR
ncbi:protein singles bar-like [Atheta coriaria]|uniref:protein singles bar-like n=1 Tax=Dalotia coriaria TaxID=877792 RepID=UPI0031F427AA